MGLMGYRTPNIDRIANEGCATDSYGELHRRAAPRSSPGRPYRTGLTKVGMADIGLQAEDATMPNCSSRWAMPPVSL